MTMVEFQNKYSVSARTVRKWLELGYIPGAAQVPGTDEWEIPDHARPPYTGARAKTAQGVCLSIVEASNKFRHVFPALYHLAPSEFEGYIDMLVQAGLICRRTVDGITYYDATLKGQEYAAQSSGKLKKLIAQCLSTVVEAAAKGYASAALETTLGKAG